MSQTVGTEASLAARYSFQQGIVYEDVLFLGLHQEIALGPDVSKESEHIHLFLVADLFEHGVQHNVGTCASDSRT